MTSEEYIKDRVDDQIAWYDRKSGDAQRRFKLFRRAEIVCAAAIPFIAGYSGTYIGAQAATGVLGAVVVVLASLLSLGRYQENWLEYRATAEALKHEKYLYLAHVEPYASENSFPLFVQAAEGFLSKENSAWRQSSAGGAKTAAQKTP